MNRYINNIDNNIDNYVDKYYGNYINKDIYVVTNNNIILCKFLEHNSIVYISDKNIKGLILRKPRSIKIKYSDGQEVILNKIEYKNIISKDLLDIFYKIINENKIPVEIKEIINNFIPEYGILF